MKGMIRAVTGALALAILVGLVSLPASAVTGMTFTVNSSGDGGDSNLSDGMCDDGTGHCTLRAAIEQANAGPGTDSITFSIGSGTQTITPSSALPTVTDPLIIDGTTQPGFAGSPIIELDGTNAGGDVNGLTVTAGNSTVKGLVINRFSRAAIDLLSEGTNVVIGNFLGTDVTGTVALGNEFGARLEISANNKVGGTSASARNLISGNTSSGVLIEANGNQVEGNLIGTDVGGNAALGNGGDGVAIFFGANNRIGGTAEGARNVISGNMFDGIGLADFGSNVTTGNEIQGNFIGTDSTGTVALPNTRAGVELDGAPSNIIGGTVAAARNLISGNGASGIFLSAGISGNGASDNLVQGNFIGTDVGGSAALGNGFDGVLILNAPGNIIGGTQVSARNVISGNHSHGIELTDFVGNATTGNQVQGNFIGTDVTGTAALGNSRTGVVIERARGNTIGGTSAGARNLISGNTSGSGVLIDNASENQVQGNFIGTDVSGSAPLGNGGGGVAILNAAGNNTIGGTSAGARNLISGNMSNGIEITEFISGTASGNQIQGNLIGTDISGTATLGNDGAGITVNGSSNNLIGGTVAGAPNVISGNKGSGVLITPASSGGGATGNQVQGNFIGTDVHGTSALGNSRDGIYLFSSADNLIGGTATGAGNVISGNAGEGVLISGLGASGNVLQGNFIGTDATGTVALGNGLFGLVVSGGASNIIGGTSGGARNLISGNFGPGVVIVTVNGEVTLGNKVEGNFIGTDLSGTTALRNQGDGIEVFAAGNTIGGTSAGAGNLISANGLGSGVLISGSNASGNAVQGNLIGTDADGTAALANAIDGVTIYGAPDNTIGGAASGARNIISGNVANGVRITGAAAVGNKVEGNFIGTDVTGTVSLGNRHEGVVISGAANTVIGGTAAGAGNVISGNLLLAGITIGDASGSQVQGNLVGTDATGTAALGNQGDGLVILDSARNVIGGTLAGAGNVIAGNNANGVFIRGADNVLEGNHIGTGIGGSSDLGNGLDGALIVGPDNTIGGTAPGAANVVAFNAGSGVEVHGTGATGDTIRGNSIYSNRTMGIDNVNGGNAELPPPAITSAAVRPLGSASGTACGTCTVDLYSDSADEGRIFEGSTVADADGAWTFSGDLAGPHVTATATDANGDTSEFSPPFAAAPTPTPAPTATATPTTAPTLTPTPTPSVTPTPTPSEFCDVLPPLTPGCLGTPTPPPPSRTATATPTPALTPTPTPGPIAGVIDVRVRKLDMGGRDLKLGSDLKIDRQVHAWFQNKSHVTELVHGFVQIIGLPDGCIARSVGRDGKFGTADDVVVTSPGGFLVDDTSSYKHGQTKKFDFRMRISCSAPPPPNTIITMIARVDLADSSLTDAHPSNNQRTRFLVVR